MDSWEVRHHWDFGRETTQLSCHPYAINETPSGSHLFFWQERLSTHASTLDAMAAMAKHREAQQNSRGGLAAILGL